jgi:hypothetical protein
MVETTDGEPDQYWFNTKTNQVEKGRQSAALYRIGPFASESEARNALETLRARAKTWREQDESEN